MGGGIQRTNVSQDLDERSFGRGGTRMNIEQKKYEMKEKDEEQMSVGERSWKWKPGKVQCLYSKVRKEL